MLILEEIKALKRNNKGIFFILLFRLSYLFANNGIILKIIGIPYRIFYYVFVQWILGIDIPDRVKIGKCFNVWHGQALVVHPQCIIGDYVSLRHCTTIGQKNENEQPPRIGNNVNIGAHCIIIGNITIGNNVIIGAGSFVNKDIPSDSVAYGNPLVVKIK